MELTSGPIWEAIADAVPDQAAVVQGDRRVPWRRRTSSAPARLAQALLDAGLGTARQGRDVPLQLARVLRDELRRAQDPRRPDQRQLPLPRQRAALPARQRRRRGARVPHLARRPRRPRARPAARRCGCSSRSTTARRADGSDARRRRRRLRETCRRRSRPADAHRARRATRSTCFYTGGTTGMPKGVMYPLQRVHRVLPAVVPADDRAAADRRTRPSCRDRPQRLFDAGTPLVAMSGPPLMHGTGCWLGMMMPHLFGGTAVLLEGRGLDPVELWDAGRARTASSTSSSSATPSPSRCCAPSTTRPTAGTCRRCA